MKTTDKTQDDLRMPADEFDRVMRGALGVAAPADGPKPNPQPSTGRKARKADRPAKK